MTNGAGGSHGKRHKVTAAKQRGEKEQKAPLKRKSLLTAGLTKEKPDEAK
jgi:hypothetical protein